MWVWHPWSTVCQQSRLMDWLFGKQICDVMKGDTVNNRTDTQDVFWAPPCSSLHRRAKTEWEYTWPYEKKKIRVIKKTTPGVFSASCMKEVWHPWKVCHGVEHQMWQKNLRLKASQKISPPSICLKGMLLKCGVSIFATRKCDTIDCCFHAMASY